MTAYALFDYGLLLWGVFSFFRGVIWMVRGEWIVGYVWLCMGGLMIPAIMAIDNDMLEAHYRNQRTAQEVHTLP